MTYRFRKKHLLLIAVKFGLLGPGTATAYETVDEHLRLATVLRELNAIERIAAAGGTVPYLTVSRYHFNYTKLREDIDRISTGIKQYLSPERATPRDVVALHGSYRDEVDIDQ
ncbi:RAQPRD family integrative conjugative element protein [Pseudomonas koreensis]|uniref:RAQPRD family integrative conjugative element protein n=1 Tax=Pseudomonas koreensis TaxID=198620 RepID=A0A9X2XE83_9PSED|nr:RAQPRD family integrative conjugative element protein [Pseudomonas koreensis]MCU7247290.1 RAQPRD family integrative conjugative element protein [Pseudomonas koreensis]